MTQNGTYPTGTYVNKDGEEKVALSARAAVALVFDGYSLKESPEAEQPAEVDEDEEVVTNFGDDTPVTEISIPTPSNLFD